MMRNRLPRRRSLAALARSRGPAYAVSQLRKRLRSNPTSIRDIEQDADWLSSSREVWGGIQKFKPSHQIDAMLESDSFERNPDIIDSINMLRRHRRRNPIQFKEINICEECGKSEVEVGPLTHAYGNNGPLMCAECHEAPICERCGVRAVNGVELEWVGDNEVVCPTCLSGKSKRRRRNPTNFNPEFHPLRDEHPFQDDSQYRKYLSRRRNPDKLICPKCNSQNLILTTAPGAYGTAPGGVWRMGDPGGSNLAICKNCDHRWTYGKANRRRNPQPPVWGKSMFQQPIGGGPLYRNPIEDDIDDVDVLKVAYEWHGGQWSALYSFASTGGVVHSEDHRDRLLSEISLCRKSASRAERSKLDALETYVENAPVASTNKRALRRKSRRNPDWATSSLYPSQGSWETPFPQTGTLFKKSRKNPVACACNPCLCGERCFCKACSRKNPAWGGSLYPSNGNWADPYASTGNLFRRKNPIGDSLYSSLFSRKNPWMGDDFSEEELHSSLEQKLSRRRNPGRNNNPWL